MRNSSGKHTHHRTWALRFRQKPRGESDGVPAHRPQYRSLPVEQRQQLSYRHSTRVTGLIEDPKRVSQAVTGLVTPPLLLGDRCEAQQGGGFSFPKAGLRVDVLGGAVVLDRTGVVPGVPGNIAQSQSEVGYLAPVADLTVGVLGAVVLDRTLVITGNQGGLTQPQPYVGLPWWRR